MLTLVRLSVFNLVCSSSASKAPHPPSKIIKMSASLTPPYSSSSSKVIDSHLHVWATPQQAAGMYPFSSGNEPTLQGDVDFLLECMEEAGVDGAMIVQPINHKFDHSLVTSVLKKYPSKFAGCLLANPADDGSGVKQLGDLILKDGYCAVRFNPNLWPPGEKMTNEVGKAMFSKAGELGAPVAFMCTKGINIHYSEIEELCSEFPATPVIIDHVGFCKPPVDDAEREAFSDLLKLSRFPQVYVKFSALFRVTRKSYPYDDTSHLLSPVLTSYGADHVMWGSDFPYVVPECGYKGGKAAVAHIASLVGLSTSDLEWLMGRTVMKLFPKSWNAAF